MLKKCDVVEKVNIQRPHLFILGAGASKAAFPNGDKNGKRLPTMDDLIEIVGLSDELNALDINFKNKNFENIYSTLYNQGYSQVLEKIENKIYKYFSALELPNYPTLYDHLVLSLRDKDVITTFNWDPFLWDACERNYEFAKPPHVLFLHGNVRVGYCAQHKKRGRITSRCRICGNVYEKSKLLYPIENKNYLNNEHIKAEWDAVTHYMDIAYLLTIFGYSAPATDVEAINLLKQGWGELETRRYEEIEIIDIKETDALEQNWDKFIYSDHYQVHKNFYDSIVANYPRRSCEAMWTMLMEAKLVKLNKIRKDCNFDELYSWLSELVSFESKGWVGLR